MTRLHSLHATTDICYRGPHTNAARGRDAQLDWPCRAHEQFPLRDRVETYVRRVRLAGCRCEPVHGPLCLARRVFTRLREEHLLATICSKPRGKRR